MQIYHYDPETGELIGEGIARSNPAFGKPEQPEYLIPAFATTIVPPIPTRSHEVAQFINGTWTVVPDMRGVIAYSIFGAVTPITTIGQTLAEMGPTDTKPTPSPEEIRDAVVIAVQDLLDRTAHERNYDNIFTLCSYATSTDPTFAAEGQAGMAWRDLVWTTCRAIMEDVIAGMRPLPTVAEVLAELPTFVWP